MAVNREPVTDDFWERGYRWLFGEEGDAVAFTLADDRRISMVLAKYY